MKRFGLVLVVGALLLALSAGVALAVFEECENDCVGTQGDNKGQDTLIGDGSDNEMIGKSAADQLNGNGGDDELRGEKGNDTLVGGPDNDRIFMGEGYDFVFAADDEADLIDCGDEEPGGRIEYDGDRDTIRNCGRFDVDSASVQSATSSGGSGDDDAVIEG